MRGILFGIWGVPVEGDKVRVGNETNWTWDVFDDGAGQIMPRGNAMNWSGA